MHSPGAFSTIVMRISYDGTDFAEFPNVSKGWYHDATRVGFAEEPPSVIN